MYFVDVILPVPLSGLFTYSLPDSMVAHAQMGCRVKVSFGTKEAVVGLIRNIHQQPPADSSIVIKEVVELLDTTPIATAGQISIWQWISEYYLCAIGEVFKAAMSAKLKGNSLKKRTSHPSVISCDFHDCGLALPTLSPAQATALASIHDEWKKNAVCLLHGVTSSGKTELYMHLISEALARGEQVLYLLPEIVLTSQLTDRLKNIFGERLGVYHSKFSDKERAEVWLRQLSDHPYEIIVGVRSSVFLPFQRLGLVIVDEEHEVNFKQQDPAPRYNARNVAILMASRTGAHVILGTATPSFESYFNARTGKYGMVQLKERFGQVQLPRIEVIDVKEMRRKRLMQGAFSPRLLEAMQKALQAGEQVILFQNRRGYAPQVQCHVCGWVPRCPHCDVPLTLHKRSSRMTCHYCGFTADVPAQCPACETPDLRGHGFGTERVEDDITRLFPEARIARMDLDTTRTRNAYEKIIEDFAAHRTDILVGTQMVTKGLDFEHVSVVGILSADTMLHQPDFRAYERSFQMMSQVAGRAGRRQQQGLVFLQTMDPQIPLIRQIVDGNYEEMYHNQMLERREFAYPPFTRFIVAYLKHRNANTVDALSREMTILLRQHFGSRVLGPDEPPVARIQSLFIRRIIIKLEHTIPLGKVRQILLDSRSTLLSQRFYSSAHIYYDVDPL